MCVRVWQQAPALALLAQRDPLAQATLEPRPTTCLRGTMAATNQCETEPRLPAHLPQPSLAWIAGPTTDGHHHRQAATAMAARLPLPPFATTVGLLAPLGALGRHLHNGMQALRVGLLLLQLLLVVVVLAAVPVPVLVQV